MRAWVLLLVLSACAAPIHVSAGRVLPAALAFDPAKLTVPDPTTHPVPPVEQLTLANGVRVSLVEARGAGLIDLSLVVRCGRLEDEPGLPGVSAAALTFALKDAGLEAVGVEPSVSVDDAELVSSFTARREDGPRLLALLGAALKAPRYDEPSVRLRREQAARAFDLPVVRERGRAFVARQRAAFPSVPALTQTETRASMEQLTAEHLRARAERCFGGENLAVALAGDVGRAELDALLAPLAALPRGALVRHLPVPPNRSRRAVRLEPTLVDQRADQVEVTIVGLGLPRGGDRAAAQALAWLLESSVFFELRGVGKIYSVDLGVDAGPDEGATWLRFTTRREEAHEATRRTLALLERWWTHWPLTQEDLDRALRFHDERLAPERRAFAHARARLQDDERFDALRWDAGATAVKEAEVRAFFVRAFRPEFLQVVVTGAVDLRQPWAQLFPAP